MNKTDLGILVDEHGLHGAMLVIGAVCLHSIPCGLAVPASPFEQSRRQQPNAPALAKLPGTLASLLRAHVTVLSDFRFLLFLLSFLAFSLGTSTLYLYLPDFLQHRGYDSLTASLVISATGIGSVVSRLLTG
nr:hypothetical protein BaRGS_016278 [Batillaria attramentaria]